MHNGQGCRSSRDRSTTSADEDGHRIGAGGYIAVLYFTLRQAGTCGGDVARFGTARPGSGREVARDVDDDVRRGLWHVDVHGGGHGIRRRGRSRPLGTCYNLGVSSIGRRHHIQWLSRQLGGAAPVPPVFLVGVVMMAAVMGGLLLRSVVAGSASGVPASTLRAPAGVPATTAGSSLADSVASPSASLAYSTSPPGTGSPAAALPSGPSSAPNVSTLTGYVWPLDQAMITLPFGPTSWGEFIVNGQLFHDGLDMATFCGDYVLAAHAGVVLAASRQYDEFIGWVGDLTPYHNLLDTKHWWNSLPITVVIDDGDGYRSIYAHESKVIVTPGQHVAAGQVIGYEGATGNATGCHVHFGLFSPTEKATFEMDPTIVKKDLVPAAEIARIDPLLVLPFRCEVEEMRVLRPAEAVGCPPLATPTPPAKATQTSAPTEQPSASAPASASASASADPTPSL